MQEKNKQALEQEQASLSQESSYSSEDDDGVLLTNEVKEKLLTVVAKLKKKDPQIYRVQKPIFQDQDFQVRQSKIKAGENQGKFTYKDLLAQKDEDSSDDNGNKAQDINLRPEDIKQKLKKNFNRIQANEDDDLFKVKKKQKSQIPKKKDQQKMKDFVSEFSKQGSQLLTKYWKDEQSLDKTDLFLRNYIINERWKTSKMKPSQIYTKNQQMIDEEDEVRSVEMDEYQANYNFRFQEPGSDKIVVYPREIPESVRLKPESRKQKRKKLAQRKKQEQQNIRKQFQQKKAQKKVQILQKIHQVSKQGKMEEDLSSDFDHDWFFCDDCAKALQEDEMYYLCNECGQYMLCEECHQLIIHKHQMQKAVIPKGAGPPKTEKAVKALNKLKSCKYCKRKIPHYLQFYQYNDKSTYLINTLCSKCYDESGLDIKKKFKLIQPQQKRVNYEQMLQANPERVKQLVTHEDVEELVDQYMKYDFEDIIAGGLKTKFKYISVKPEGYGLSDEQILYGDDRELNKYVSIKKIGPYEDEQIKLRNNLYRRKITSINRSAKQNKRLISQHKSNPQALRTIKKIQSRAELLRKRREAKNTKLKIINISNQEDEKKLMVKKSRLESYGIAVDQQKQTYLMPKKKKITKANNN